MEYILMFLKRVSLPGEAEECLTAAAEKIFADEKLRALFVKLKEDFYDFEIGVNEAFEEFGEIQEEAGIHEFTLDLLFLIYCTEELLERYREEGVPEELFWDAMDDFRCKMIECHDVKGVWGTFVGHWYTGFLDFSRFALGRFQYEEVTFSKEKYEKNGITVNKGDAVYNFHIPSSGQPFGREARLESYRRAYEFFGYDKKKEPIVFVCDSWLLYEGHREFLPEGSNILSFMDDFDIIVSEEKETFGDGWRVFGKYAELPPEELPENTSLRRAFKKRLVSGGKTGGGFGIIVFDGESIINK